MIGNLDESFCMYYEDAIERKGGRIRFARYLGDTLFGPRILLPTYNDNGTISMDIVMRGRKRDIVPLEGPLLERIFVNDKLRRYQEGLLAFPTVGNRCLSHTRNPRLRNNTFVDIIHGKFGIVERMLTFNEESGNKTIGSCVNHLPIRKTTRLVNSLFLVGENFSEGSRAFDTMHKGAMQHY